ncbi:hypothetical protein H2202_001788 [Exophiala xenobiotica]|nr:hypothetical protein H2202_001788 [Exophiala xenobiotica]KAK5407172.1 hypothetical protein LTR06_007914 [Exophiala xenobiotica]
MTARDIIRAAGPCPMPRLASQERMATLGLLDNDAGADEQVANEGAGQRGEDADVEKVDPGAVAGHCPAPQTLDSVLFATHGPEDPLELVGGLDAEMDAPLFTALMEECRRKGQGCMIDLAKFHPMGRIAMVRWNWSKADEERYDRTGKPPCSTGMLGSSVPMVVVCNNRTRWMFDYAPEECTVGQVEHYRNAHPCIAVLSSLPKELAHLTVQRWVVPSEFMPMVQVGDLKAASSKAPLIMEGQHDIEQFIVTEANLHHTIYEFLSGKDLIHVGFYAVAVNPKDYLKTIGRYKEVGKSKFEECASREKQVWDKVTRQLSP